MASYPYTVDIGFDKWHLRKLKYPGKKCEKRSRQLNQIGKEVYITKRGEQPWALRCKTCIYDSKQQLSSSTITNISPQIRSNFNSNPMNPDSWISTSTLSSHFGYEPNMVEEKKARNDDEQGKSDEDDAKSESDSKRDDNDKGEDYDDDNYDDNGDNKVTKRRKIYYSSGNDSDSVDLHGNLKDFIEEDDENIEDILDEAIDADQSTDDEYVVIDDDAHDETGDIEESEGDDDDDEEDDDVEVEIVNIRYKLYCYRCKRYENRDSFSDGMKRKYKDSNGEESIYCLKHTATSCYNRSYRRSAPINLSALIAKEQRERAASDARHQKTREQKESRSSSSTESTKQSSSENCDLNTQSSSSSSSTSSNKNIFDTPLISSSNTNRKRQESNIDATPTRINQPVIESTNNFSSNRLRKRHWRDDRDSSDDDSVVFMSSDQVKPTKQSAAVYTPAPNTASTHHKQSGNTHRYPRRYHSSTAVSSPPLTTMVFDEHEEEFEFDVPLQSSRTAFTTPSNTNTVVRSSTASIEEIIASTRVRNSNVAESSGNDNDDDDDDAFVFSPRGKKICLVEKVQKSKLRRVLYDDDEDG